LIALLCDRAARCGALWLDNALEILCDLDADDFERVSSSGADPVQRVNALMEAIAAELPAALRDLHAVRIERSCKRLGSKFVRSTLLLIACAPDGLRESDLAFVMAAGWDPVSYGVICWQFQKQLARDRLGRWAIQDSYFHSTVLRNCGSGAEQEKFHNLLGEMYRSLPSTDPRRAEAIGHFLRGKATLQAARMIGEWEDIPVAGIREPIIHRISRLLLNDISSQESQFPNPAAAWLCQLIAAPGLEPVVRFRICQRVMSPILPTMVRWVCSGTSQEILDSCRAVLHDLFHTLPEQSRPIGILSIGADKEFAHAIGACTVEDAEERTLTKEKVAPLLERTCSALAAFLQEDGRTGRAMECLVEAEDIRAWQRDHFTGTNA
jgi:hypothetical protein